MKRRALVVSSLVIAFGCTEVIEPAHDDKLDAALQAAMRAGTRVPVLILGSRQLMMGAGAFSAFTSANASADRLVLRSRVLSDLRSISQDQRGALLDESWPAGARGTGLWLINAAFALLTRSEIERAAARPEVAYLYLLPGGLPPATAIGSAMSVPSNSEPFTTDGKRIAWNIERIGAPAAWADGFTGAGVVAALIDTPVRITHSDLISHIWRNADEVAGNGVDDDGNGYVDDLHGYDFTANSPDNARAGQPHGTFVAGIVAGDGSAGTVTGVAPRARIMPLVAFGFVEVALALQYALEEGADVVNMSFSLPNQNELRGAWRMLADHAVAAGLVLVSGAGNFRQTAPVPVQLRTPEDIPSVIAAGGVNEELEVTTFSSNGPVEWASVPFYGDHPMPRGLVKPDVAAFAGPRYPVLNAAGGYVDPNLQIAGNSFSGPQVTGAAALLLSANPRLPAWRIAEILQATARDLGPVGKDNASGAGLIDIAAALRLVRDGG